MQNWRRRAHSATASVPRCVQKHNRQSERGADVAVGTRPNTVRKTEQPCARPPNLKDRLAATTSPGTERADNDHRFLVRTVLQAAIDLAWSTNIADVLVDTGAPPTLQSTA